MTALASPFGAIRQHESPYGLQCGQSRISVTYQKGSLVAHRRGSRLYEVPLASAKRSDLIFVGTFIGNEEFAASASADGDGGALNTDGSQQIVSAHPGGTGWFDTGSGANAITTAHVGMPCFAFNDNTLYLTDLSGTLSYVGMIQDVNTAGKVKVNIEPLAGLQGIYSAANTAPPIVHGVVVANVADLAAFTVANNGITHIEGNRILLTAQTTAAQCGIYVVGAVDAGAAPLTRSADMSTGAVVRAGTVIEVGPGNTEYSGSTWKALTTQAGGATVGTHDPVFYPKTYKQTVTLAAGTYTIGTGSTATPDEALFLRSDASVQLSLNTPNTTTLTTEYCAPTASRTAGKPGTAALLLRANVAAGTINVADVSTVDVAVTNW